MQHQLELIAQNARFIVTALGWGLVALAVVAFFAMRPWRRPDHALWAFGLPLALFLSCLYLPVFGGASRYYIVAHPILLATAILVLRDLAGRCHMRPGRALAGAFVLTAVLAGKHYFLPVSKELSLVDKGYAAGLREAIPVAALLEDAAPCADVASVDDERRVGAFLAYVANRRWRGNVLLPSMAEVKKSGARVFVVNTRHGLIKQFIDDRQMMELIPPPALPGTAAYRAKVRYFLFNDQEHGSLRGLLRETRD
jgi:hypothetical protein